MRLVLAAALLSASPAMACDKGFIEVVDWQINERRSDSPIGAEVSISYRLSGERSYRLIDGSFTFIDAFDFEMGRIAIPKEVSLGIGEIGQQKGVYPSSALMQAARMHRDDITVSSCVRAVVYSDGTKEQF